MPDAEPKIGQTWRGKRQRDQYRRIEITSISEPYRDRRGDQRVDVFVRRNTSRRRQAISLKVLLRDYELIHQGRAR